MPRRHAPSLSEPGRRTQAKWSRLMAETTESSQPDGRIGLGTSACCTGIGRGNCGWVGEPGPRQARRTSANAQIGSPRDVVRAGAGQRRAKQRIGEPCDVVRAIRAERRTTSAERARLDVVHAIRAERRTTRAKRSPLDVEHAPAEPASPTQPPLTFTSRRGPEQPGSTGSRAASPPWMTAGRRGGADAAEAATDDRWIQAYRPRP